MKVHDEFNQEEEDIYSDEMLDELIDNDELSASESGFMLGYNAS